MNVNVCGIYLLLGLVIEEDRKRGGKTTLLNGPASHLDNVYEKVKTGKGGEGLSRGLLCRRRPRDNPSPPLPVLKTTVIKTPGYVRWYTRAECPDSWVAFHGSCYLFSHDLKTFTDAENFCLQRGSHLVHIETSHENLFLKSFCRELKTHNYWLGMTDADIEGIWKWKDNDAEVTFTDFYPTEPSSGHVENCGVLWAGFDFKWGDYGCGGQCMPICEKKSTTAQEVIG